MNAEYVLVIGFFLVRLVVVGSLLLALPRILRSGLLYGAYVGEDVVQLQRDDLLRRWDLGCGLAMASALVVGLSISLAGWPLPGNLIGTAVLLVGAAVNYSRMNAEARALVSGAATRQARVTVASLTARDPWEIRLGWAVVSVCVAVPVLVYAFVRLTVPLSALAQQGAVFVAGLNLAFSPFFAVLTLWVAGAKRSLRGGNGGHSLQAQDAFRTAMLGLYGGISLLMCVALSTLSVQILRLGEGALLAPAVWVTFLALLLFMVGGQIWVMVSRGQGGAHLEADDEGPLTGAIAVNVRWTLGLFYAVSADPAMMVEARFGLGYTLNYGHRSARWLVVGFLGLLAWVVGSGLVTWFG